MRDLPVGTVTFLFTDIEGSTRLLDESAATSARTVTETLDPGGARAGDDADEAVEYALGSID